MERDHNTFVMPVECGGSLGLASAANCCEEKTLDGFNPLVCGAIARPTSRVVISSSSNNAAAMLPSFQSALIPSIAESRWLQVNDRTHQSQDSLTFSKHEISSDGVICHNLKPCHPQSDTFEVQLSETCQRKFVIFDQSGSKNRIIFHPSLVNDFPTLLQFPQIIGNCWEYMQEASPKALSSEKETLISPLFSVDHCAFDTILPPSWRSDLFQVYDREGCKQSGTSNCISQENSEDLEALLWSDDEMSSTGHSLCGFTRSDAQFSIANGSGSYSVCCGKKRKASEEGETESTATSRNQTSKKVLCRSSENMGRDSVYGKESFTLVDPSFTEEGCSSGSINNKRQHVWQGLTPERIVKKKARKEKLQDTLHILRSIIPGGESMGAALVLDEAVQFVKNLQVELEKLESKKAA